jgi:membrane protease YdiL (CAAX protease family)
MILVGPVMEEVAFRGGVYNILRNGLLSTANKEKQILLEVVAVILQTAIFLGIHCFGGIPQTLFGLSSIVVVGAVCALAYRFGKSLWVPVMLHIAWNTGLYAWQFATA